MNTAPVCQRWSLSREVRACSREARRDYIAPQLLARCRKVGQIKFRPVLIRWKHNHDDVGRYDVCATKLHTHQKNVSITVREGWNTFHASDKGRDRVR